ncbi:ABC-type transport auxiliary lipoprotein family protein [Caenimonas aquaedulcis]|uniref:Membrane integrity-associated transporter subunit PqiC n=1 Tax=Caenimonas aquaedulcis TaxID=2793270 RepID=A0A931H504_9BURK|nr:ABC-type transport auxiliary lipoprotein family protein [Caenimonas aquaedulcis]MBG9388750.1 membrane integrity-associated transporter subunit PqiC [Caenimonas aquaedulcis]
MTRDTFTRLSSALLLAALLGACSALPDKPVRATLYDFGPLLEAAAPARLTGAPIALADVEAAGALDGSSILYRLGYADDHQLRPYANSRWSATPPQLMRQRLRQQLGRERAVLDLVDTAALARSGGASPRVLHIDLEEFSQLFETAASSFGVVRIRATLMDNTAGGEVLVAQRAFTARRPAPTADASGGVRALAQASDAVADELAQWLNAQR